MKATIRVIVPTLPMNMMNITTILLPVLSSDVIFNVKPTVLKAEKHSNAICNRL